MFYYDVAIAGSTRGSKGIFTYSSPQKLPEGQWVEVTLRGKNALGFIVKKSSVPEFKTAAIASILDSQLPTESLLTYLDLIQFYPLGDQAVASFFMPPNRTKRTTEHPLLADVQATLEPLNKEQSEIFDAIVAHTGNVLLHGDTGTGKTRIYKHIMARILASGENAFLLAPEIGLASFLYEEVSKFFPHVHLYHSKLTPKQRSLVWNCANCPSSPVIMIGPRSVLSLPLKNLGGILIDESHDQSYRQENFPFINAKIVASLLAKHHGTRVIYGSATPLVSEISQARATGVPIFRLTTPAVRNEAHYDVKIVSYESQQEKTSGSMLRSSLSSVSSALNSGGQSLVMINRRGTARYISCESCGHESRCSICERLLTYHRDAHELRCHHCERRFNVPLQCENCGQAEITMRSFGSKAVVDELQRAFPEALIKRFDTDTSKKEHLSSSYDDIASGKIQIIVGTQMIAKGLDLPKLKTLVVLSGGSSIGYTSEEREFQLLYQVLGRAMRGHQSTEVMIQSSNPDSKVLRWAIERDYESFSEAELKDRKIFHYPPFCYMLLIHVRKKSTKSAREACHKVAEQLATIAPSVEIGPPTPNTTERIGPYFHWHLTLKSSKRSTLTKIAESIGSSFMCELDPVDLP